MNARADLPAALMATPAGPSPTQAAEHAVLGCLLQDSKTFDQVADSLTSGDFDTEGHDLTFSTIAALAQQGKPADVVAVYERLESQGQAACVGGLAYLHQLSQSVIGTASLKHCAGLVRKHADLRRLVAAALTLKADASSPGTRSAADILATFAAQTEALTRPASGWLATMRNWKPLPNLATREVRVDFAVEGLIQTAKVGALVAAGGTGKTTLLLTLGACIALGRPFMGREVKQGTFVLLSNDDSQEDLDGALALVVRALLLTPEEAAIVAAKVRVISLQGTDCPTFVSNVHGQPEPTAFGVALLKELQSIPDLVGFALDTLRQFSGGATNDEQVMKATIAGCTKIAVATGAFCVLPHHTGKQNYRDGVADMYAGSGSAAIADNCRFVLVLQTATWADIEQQVARTGHEDGRPLVLRPTRGSLLVKAAEPVFMVRNGHRMEAIAGQSLTAAQQLDKRDREILAAVRGGAQTKNAINAAVTGKKSAVNHAVDDLLGRGLLVPDEAGGSRGGSQKLMVSATGAKALEQMGSA